MFSELKSIIRRIPNFSNRNANVLSLFVPKKYFHNLNLNKSDQHKPEKVINKQRNRPAQKQDLNPNRNSHYYIENGLRKVYPYYYKHSTNCKGRWFNRTLLDVYTQEFALYPEGHIKERILNGSLQVNEKRVGLDYELKNNDVITSYIHRHELPILAVPIKTLFEDDKLLVIDKPPSIPVHPCGMYRYNSLVFLLAEEYNRIVYLIHRLDRLTSGVLILAKDSLKSREMHDEILLHNVQKEYLCRVEGDFPDGVVVCDKPLKQFYKNFGVSLVHPEGKPSTTEFQKLSFNGNSSAVLCRPKTGRTHQIRVHLQYLGYPIVNDPLYNCYAFGPDKGKHGKIHKTHEQLMHDLVIRHSAGWWIGDEGYNENPIPNVDYSMEVEESLKLDLNAKMNISSTDLFSSMNYGIIDENTHGTIYKKIPQKITHEKNCYLCTKVFRNPKPSNLVMFLHAFKYKGEKWEFSSEIPSWAQSNWNII